ncbi:MAG: adenylate cyclase [Cycloclasticus sp. symbiont of Bathymodiolus heckerae]|nr:MAG: adenylate cyclase [Cycloclasticus sp. symbiont of Bathymodiolus heckerae]
MVNSVKQPSQERHLKSVNLVGPDGQISKKDIRLIKQRFLNLHKLKMQRALDAVTPRQKIFLELLPLLFHVNHPVLPGYVSSKTPAGIADYAPSKLSIEKAKKLGKGFVYSKRAKRSFGIESLYLMGSVGSIAYVKGSDMDLWLCHAPNLPGKELKLLEEKASDIEKWAETLGLEVHFFLMNAEQFKHGAATPLSVESSGSTQHHLLLEEFYRTALYVAGRYPVWWLVPPEEESNYQAFVDNLVTQRFIDQHDVIDFGGLENVPAEEFLGASFWHLYKAIDSPYKSLLKLMLMESYVDQYLESHWAALQMKQRVYAGESDANKLDAYLILYDVLEAYFVKKNEPERLNLMRYCFYSKLNEHRNGAKHDWRQEVFTDMLKQWLPLPDYLENALEHKEWDISQVQQEKERLTNELTHNYRLLMRFAKERIDKSKRDSEELTLLGRKLNAAFEKRPSKLERSTIKNTRVRKESKVILKQHVAQNGQVSWLLNRLDTNNQEQFIRQAHGLIGLLAWCVDYGVLGDKTKIALDPGASQINSREVAQTLRSVALFFSTLPKKPADLDAYRYKPVVTNVMLVINSGIDSMSDFTDKGINLTSERSDALSFGSQRRNLIQSVDMMFRNSWNEIVVGKYDGMGGLMACLCEIFDHKTLGERQELPTLVCSSYNSPRAMSVSKRIQMLFKEIAAVFKRYSQKMSPRLVIQSARSFCIMQVKDRKMTSLVVTQKQLLAELSKPQSVFSPIKFDNFIDQRELLPVICGHHKVGLIQLYYTQLNDAVAQVYILDEKGSLFFKEHPFLSEESLLQSYKELLESIMHRRRLAAYEQDDMGFDLEMECYRIEKIRQNWGLKKVNVSEKSKNAGMNVRVAYDGQTKEFHVYCNEQTFSSLDYGKELYNEASAYIRKERKGEGDYPAYITDIDVTNEELGVTAGTSLQTIHYLNYKQEVERKLNV